MDGFVTAAHVHRAAVGQVGPHYIDLFNGVSLSGTGSTSGCVPATSSQMSTILRSPSQFHVNLHSAAYSSGALRGQLG